MTNGRSEGPEPTPERLETGADASIRETPRSGSSPRRTVVPAPASQRVAVAVFKGLANVVFVGLLIYLTYFFTMFFSTRPPSPAPVPESARVATKKIEELRAEERQLLTTYGPANPATKSVRIPIDRAMALMVAEGGRPSPTSTPLPTSPSALTAPKAGAVTAAPKAGAVTATPKAGTANVVPNPATVPPAAAPARVGMAPDQLYRAICIACHDVDGRGTIVRKAMPTIPDLTDSKWQASHNDAEMIHSMLDGKGQFMLPMKDKFALAHTDVKDMLAFMRSFQTGKQVVAAGTPTPASPAPAATLAIASGATTPGATSASTSGPARSTTAPASSPATALAPANLVAAPLPSASPVVAPVPMPSHTRTLSTVPSPERAAKVRVAGEFYNINCVACHGPDGRGNAAIRIAMPALPDFTTREWQTSRDNPQLAISVLDGKGALMPPWRGRVDPALAQDLVAFIRTFGPAGLVAADSPTGELGTRLRQLRQQWQVLDQQAQALSRP